jgi:hypothetical protein
MHLLQLVSLVEIWEDNMFLVEQVPLYPQQVQQVQQPPQLDQNGQPIDQQDMQQEVQPEEPVEYTSLKKYYLAQKLSDFNVKMKQYNMRNEALETVLKFIDVLSYETLVSLSNNLINTLNAEIERAQQNASKRKVQSDF